MAQIAQEEPKLLEIIQKEEASDMSAKLREFPGGHKFNEKFARFIEDFGHMGDNMGDIMSPRWREEPSSIWKLLKLQLSGRNEDPVSRDSRIVKERKKTIAKVMDYLSSGWRSLFPIQQLQFSLILRFTVGFAPYRENIKFHTLKGFILARRMGLCFGSILRKNGYLKSEKDVFFLEYTEMRNALDNKATIAQILSLVEERRAQMDRWSKMVPSHHLYTKGNQVVRKVYDEANRFAQKLQGVPGSAGLVRGKARIIMELGEANRLQPGEILVARFTDPAWTPLFNLASGIVVDIGSMLSHGAVVARELGIPAVVGVRFGTEVIQDGQEITVDGTAGTVGL
jgi:pyruvate,water dikinase